jgi:2-dehydropantoate 2-reductase
LTHRIGAIDEVQLLFKSNINPSFLAGITNHGLYKKGDFTSVHAAITDMIIGPVPGTTISTDTKNFMDLLVSTPILAATRVTSTELLRVQLAKLAVNAVINPLTAIFECNNGDVFLPARDGLVRALIQEISAVEIRILQASDPNANTEAFSQDHLYEYVQQIGAKVAKNVSSMRQDVVAGKPTEIDYINGYIVRRAHEFNLPCVRNEILVGCIKNNIRISDDEISSVFKLNASS